MQTTNDEKDCRERIREEKNRDRMNRKKREITRERNIERETETDRD